MSKTSPRGDKIHQESIRLIGARLIAEGKGPVEVAGILGCSTKTVDRWKAQIKKEGAFKRESFLSKPRGARPSQNALLSQRQENAIRRLVADRSPEQLKLPFYLWTRESVRQLIHKRYGIKVAVRTMGSYLKKWGFTPQKPAKAARKQEPQEVQQWLKETYPTIAKEAAKAKAQIHWMDETSVQADNHQRRSYAPKGQTPVVADSGQWIKHNLISSITNGGKLRFKLYKGSLKWQGVRDFLQRLGKEHPGSPLVVIMDNHPTHKSKKLKEWVHTQKDWLTVHYLPRYSPELNPDEYLNNDLKANVNAHSLPRNGPELAKNLTSYLHRLQKHPKKVASFFRHKSALYAA